MIILGVDPGTATTGFGLVKKTKKKLICLDYGIIKTKPDLENAERLKILFNSINSLIRKYNPDFLAIEKLYFFKNLKTALPVSEARGVILLLSAQKKVKLRQFTPLEIKMAVCGYGRAEKKQIQRMVKEILSMKETPKPDDAADGLACAICAAIYNNK